MKHINIQPIEKQNLRSDGVLEVNSIFYTIQGEGLLAGSPAVFVRLAGCNLQCPSCDTEYTNREEMTVFEVADKVQQLFLEYTCPNLLMRKLVVITGGEPFRQNLKPITNDLISLGYMVQIETNGTLYQELNPNIMIMCSPKTGQINRQMVERADAFKYVIDSANVDKDGLPLQTLGHPNSGCVFKAPLHKIMFIQPADSKNDIANQFNLAAAKESVMKFNRVLCIQIHKIIGVE